MEERKKLEIYKVTIENEKENCLPVGKPDCQPELCHPYARG